MTSGLMPIQPGTAPTVRAGVRVDHNVAKKMAQAAQDFEAVLLGTVLESLEKTFSGIGEGGTPGSGDYRYMGVQALAAAIAARGGIGIGKLILKQLEGAGVPSGTDRGSVQKG